MAYALNGRLDEAIAAAEKANELSGGTAMTLGALGRVYGLAGRTAEARQLQEELTTRRRLTYVPASALASVHSGLGERDKSLEWIARAVEERDPATVTALKIGPNYDPLRSHPAFEALLRTMNLVLFSRVIFYGLRLNFCRAIWWKSTITFFTQPKSSFVRVLSLL